MTRNYLECNLLIQNFFGRHCSYWLSSPQYLEEVPARRSLLTIIYLLGVASPDDLNAKL